MKNNKVLLIVQVVLMYLAQLPFYSYNTYYTDCVSKYDNGFSKPY